MMAKIRHVVKQYPMYFNEKETNQSMYDIASTELVSTTVGALNANAGELYDSAIASIIVGVVLVSFEGPLRRKFHGVPGIFPFARPLRGKPASEAKPAKPAGEGQEAKPKPESKPQSEERVVGLERDSRYVKAVDGVSQNLSTLAPVVGSIIGGVGVITSTLTGFTLAGITLIIVTRILGISIVPLSADLVIQQNPNGTVVLNNDIRNKWELMTMAQFWMFILGFGLVACGLISIL